LRLRVDQQKCEGHNRCYSAFPELFDVDDEGKSSARMEVVPAGWEERADRAVANCPEHAISVEQ
jgi:ferredoxin